MVSSEIEEITEGSDRAYVLRDGRTVSMLEGEALTEDGILAAMAHGIHQDRRQEADHGSA